MKYDVPNRFNYGERRQTPVARCKPTARRPRCTTRCRLAPAPRIPCARRLSRALFALWRQTSPKSPTACSRLLQFSVTTIAAASRTSAPTSLFRATAAQADPRNGIPSSHWCFLAWPRRLQLAEAPPPPPPAIAGEPLLPRPDPIRPSPASARPPAGSARPPNAPHPPCPHRRRAPSPDFGRPPWQPR